MHLEYVEKEEQFLFRYRLIYEVAIAKDEHWVIMDINEWICKQFGPIGKTWSWENNRINILDRSIAYSSRNPPTVVYNWQFKNKADAMQFKLVWHR